LHLCVDDRITSGFRWAAGEQKLCDECSMFYEFQYYPAGGH
jgi:hypothetical protein